MNFTQRYQSDSTWFTELDRLFNSGRALPARSTNQETIHETPDSWVLRIDLPGFAKADLALKATGQTLQITGETPADRAFAGKIDRQWKLGTRIDPANIQASLENGVLEITLPKIDAPESINIEIL